MPRGRMGYEEDGKMRVGTRIEREVQYAGDQDQTQSWEERRCGGN